MKASNKTKINISIAIIEIVDPKEETIFHEMKASG